MFASQPVEGMPGTWSHCGRRTDHSPHRHRVVMNEGPYENVLCLGTPGDPHGFAPLAQIYYDKEDERCG